MYIWPSCKTYRPRKVSEKGPAADTIDEFVSNVATEQILYFLSEKMWPSVVYEALTGERSKGNDWEDIHQIIEAEFRSMNELKEQKK